MRTNLFKMTRAVTIAVAMAFTLSCSDDKDDDGNPSGGSNAVYGPSVTYEGKTYKTVKIGTQTWMAENLNYNVPGSKCGTDDGKLSDANTAACGIYGRLYDWSTAKTICPSGWHLPSDAEWDALIMAVGDSSTAGSKLKATSGWNNKCGKDSKNGTDDYGFAALPGGDSADPGYFDDVGVIGFWWSATEYEASNLGAYNRGIYCNTNKVVKKAFSKSALFSVRCVQD